MLSQSIIFIQAYCDGQYDENTYNAKEVAAKKVDHRLSEVYKSGFLLLLLYLWKIIHIAYL